MSNDSSPGASGAKPASRPEEKSFTPGSDATQESAATNLPEPKPGPFLWCSDCRAAMRTYYYALDTRPLCQKCKIPYAAQIARGSGPGSLTRVLLYGGGTALACAVLLGIGVLAFGFLRALAAVGIGYAVGKAVNHASGNYLDTRFRLIAAVFTYVALGLGSLAPVFKGLAEAPDRPAVVASAAADDTGDDADAATDDDDVMDLDALTTQMENDREAAKQAAREMSSYDRTKAADDAALASKGFVGLLVALTVLLLTLPLLANFAWGMYAGTIGILAIGYGVYKAWQMTGETNALYLSGPHRVGTGPVPPTHW